MLICVAHKILLLFLGVLFHRSVYIRPNFYNYLLLQDPDGSGRGQAELDGTHRQGRLHSISLRPASHHHQLSMVGIR
jgi:hypothetical protein